MPRRARQESFTAMYHVMVRGLNKLPVFNQTREKTRIINLLRENILNYEVAIYAYCIMSNHFHLLIKADVKILASFMAKVLAAYAHYYNFKHNRIGYVFQDRFKSQCVEEEAYFWNCLRYIHNNPFYKGKIEELLSYRYCSMAEFYYNKRDIIDESALNMKNCKFDADHDFLDFHKISSRVVFADVDEDVYRNNLAIAKEILAEMQRKTGLSGEEILEYIKTRKEFEKVLAESVHISKKKAQEFENIIRQELVGTD